MKDYGNLVRKYVPGNQAYKYKMISADSLIDYQKKQLADLKRFLKDDFRVPGNRDNYLHYSALIKKQMKEIDSEIKRLEGQIASTSKVKEGPKKRASKKKSK